MMLMLVIILVFTATCRMPQNSSGVVQASPEVRQALASTTHFSFVLLGQFLQETDLASCFCKHTQDRSTESGQAEGLRHSYSSSMGTHCGSAMHSVYTFMIAD